MNFLNPEHELQVLSPGTRLGWQSVTTGNVAGVDLWLDGSDAMEIAVETNIASGCFAASEIGLEDMVVPAGGIDRQLRVFRLPERLSVCDLAFDHDVACAGPADLPVYVRLTQEDGHQAWSSSDLPHRLTATRSWRRIAPAICAGRAKS